jgi:hypothetical protein
VVVLGEAGVGKSRLVNATGNFAGSRFVSSQWAISQAEAGEVLVSSTVRDLVAGSDIDFEEQGERMAPDNLLTWRLFLASSAARSAAPSRRREPPAHRYRAGGLQILASGP